MVRISTVLGVLASFSLAQPLMGAEESYSLRFKQFNVSLRVSSKQFRYEEFTPAEAGILLVMRPLKEDVPVVTFSAVDPALSNADFEAKCRLYYKELSRLSGPYDFKLNLKGKVPSCELLGKKSGFESFRYLYGKEQGRIFLLQGKLSQPKHKVAAHKTMSELVKNLKMEGATP